MIEPHVDFVFPEDEPPAQRHDNERGEALRGLVELVSKGRTPGARLLRLSVLALLLRTGDCESVAQIAKRFGLTKRRVQQELRGLRNFAFGIGEDGAKFRQLPYK